MPVKLNNTVPCPNCNGDGRVLQFPPEPQHVGLHASRMDHPCASTTREKAFSDQWKKENGQENSWDSSSQSVLNGILYNRLATPKEFSTFGEIQDGSATQREATIAATLVQWLGTNCGWDFVRLALKAAGYEMVPVSERENREKEVSGIRQEIKVLRERKARVRELEAEVDRLRKTLGDITLCEKCGGTGKDPKVQMSGCCAIGHAKSCQCKLCQWRRHGYKQEQQLIERDRQLAEAREAVPVITELLDALEYCHACGGQIALDETLVTHCEGCSYDCDDHDEPACTPIYVLHDRVRKVIASMTGGDDKPSLVEKLCGPLCSTCGVPEKQCDCMPDEKGAE